MPSVNAKSFLEDLKAAVLLGCELETGDTEPRGDTTASAPLSVSQLDGLSSGNTDESDLSAWPRRLKAAFGVFRHTGTMPIVFEALSVRLNSNRWVGRVLRRAWWYLLLVIATMVAGLFFVYHYTNEQRQDFLANSRLGSKVTAAEFDPTTWIPAVTIVAIVLGVIFLCWVLLGGSRRLTMRLGGRKILQLQQTATLLKVLEQVDASGESGADSINLACDAVAAGPKVRHQVHAALDGSGSNVGLSAWAESLAKDARTRMVVIEVWLPIFFVTIIGGALALLYGFLIYGPIVKMLQELSSVEIL